MTYESTKTDGRRFRNTEVLTFEGDKICKAEVYFGWTLSDFGGRHEQRTRRSSAASTAF